MGIYVCGTGSYAEPMLQLGCNSCACDEYLMLIKIIQGVDYRWTIKKQDAVAALC